MFLYRCTASAASAASAASGIGITHRILAHKCGSVRWSSALPSSLASSSSFASFDHLFCFPSVARHCHAFAFVVPCIGVCVRMSHSQSKKQQQQPPQLRGIPLAEVVKDLNKRWSLEFKQTAENGEVASMFILGQMYYRGWGAIPKNHKKALAWWRAASMQGCVESSKILQRHQRSKTKQDLLKKAHALIHTIKTNDNSKKNRKKKKKKN